MNPMQVSRSGLAAAVSVVAWLAGACTDSNTMKAHSTRHSKPKNVWANAYGGAVAARGRGRSLFQTTTPIKHVVFLIKENRTFDHLFERSLGPTSTSIGMDHGVPRPLVRGTDGRVPSDIPHCYECSRLAWDNGKMDNFDQGSTGDPACAQLQDDQLPNYWHWASRNVLFDEFFASAWGPSFPNHLYSIAAQSGGARENPRRPGLLLEHVRLRRAEAAEGGGLRPGRGTS